MAYSELEIQKILTDQRAFFRSGQTLSVAWRINQLKKLRRGLIDYKERFEDALQTDLGRSKTEAYLCDIGPALLEINEMIRGMRRWARPELHYSGLHCFPSMITRVYPMPYGVTLIISPFNFPILLTIGVLAAAISGGNTAILKTSSKSVACTAALKECIEHTFPREYVALIDGGHETADICLKQRFDKIFYTGSPEVGKHVLASAAGHLTPVALELGGETGNWCIVRRDADIRDAARKIAFMKLCNAGQICININQVAVAKEVAEDFLRELIAAFESQISSDATKNLEYPKLITDAAYQKCAQTAEAYAPYVRFGGLGDSQTRRFSPTVLYPISVDDSIIMHELFSPMLPIVPFQDAEIDRLLDTIEEREHPLALYIFTKDMRWAKRTMQTLQYGGGCVNEVCVHLMVKGVPFNGTGHSGMGAYHGRWGFREFTHPSTVLYGKTHLNLSIRTHPYSGRNEKRKLFLLRLLER